MQAMSAATSSGWPSRGKGWAVSSHVYKAWGSASFLAANSRTAPCMSGVSMVPGHTTLKRMPSGAYSAAHDLASWAIAALDMPYRFCSGLPTSDWSEPTMTTAPVFRARMCGSTACTLKKQPLTLIAMTRSYWASVTCCILPPVQTPAFDTSTSTRPSWASAIASIARFTPCTSLTSTVTCVRLPPVLDFLRTSPSGVEYGFCASGVFFSRNPPAVVLAALVGAGGSTTSRLYTVPPASARASHVARPMPVLPPVTTQTSPANDGNAKGANAGGAHASDESAFGSSSARDVEASPVAVATAAAHRPAAAAATTRSLEPGF
mmetsp:Transcript_7760/g.32107  ORF Transcript_7760/g.32107 Transcript_7760/m.32107 type:complete len:320 (-) Transcript_7760:191-1150(-)